MATQKQAMDLAKKLVADWEAGNVTGMVLCWSVDVPGGVVQKGAVTGDPINLLRCYKSVKESLESRVKDKDISVVLALLDQLDKKKGGRK